MNLVRAVEPAELATLEARWGRFPQQHHRLEVDHPFLSGENQRLVRDGRRAEICYVMHRGNPAQGVLLQIKTYYPTGAFRLPTGGIHQGEGVWETLSREVEEETGLVLGEGADQVQVQQFLGVVSYELPHRSLGRTFEYATYCFLMQMPPGAELQPQDETEQIGGWHWQPPTTFHQIADRLEKIGGVTQTWGDWGRYRAVVHRFVGEILT